LGDEGVAEGGKAVHPIGNPISHSTHAGFNAPGLGGGVSLPVRSLRLTSPRRVRCALAPEGRRPVKIVTSLSRRPPLPSAAFGVGQSSSLATAVTRSSPPLLDRFFLAKSGPLADAFGVGQSRDCTAPDSVSRPRRFSGPGGEL